MSLTHVAPRALKVSLYYLYGFQGLSGLGARRNVSLGAINGPLSPTDLPSTYSITFLPPH